MERELVMTGIGGQGIQLAAQVLARAAITDGLQAQLFGSYGGMMRGGRTEATVVVADRAIESPPTVGRTWSAILMHDEFASGVARRVVDDGLLFVNAGICKDLEIEEHRTRVDVVDIPATDLAVDAGNILAASMVMLGAWVERTGIVSGDALDDAIASSLPSYRTQHIELNQRAVRVGRGAVSSRTSAEA